MVKQKRSYQIEYLERQARLNNRTNLIFDIRKDISDTASVEHERLQADGVMMFTDVDKDRVAAIQKRDTMKQKGAAVVSIIRERERRRA